MELMSNKNLIELLARYLLGSLTHLKILKLSGISSLFQEQKDLEKLILALPKSLNILSLNSVSFDLELYYSFIQIMHK